LDLSNDFKMRRRCHVGAATSTCTLLRYIREPYEGLPFQ
jgi:hypothetical protein